MPPPVTVMVAARWEVDVLTVAVTFIVALFEPEEGNTVSHVAVSLLTFQFVLDRILNVLCWPDDVKLKEDSDTFSVTAVPACVTLMVCVLPLPVTVMIAVRSELDVLVAAVTMIVPLLEPEDGDTVNQDEAPLLTLQLMFDVIVNDFCSPTLVKIREVVDTDKDNSAPACVTSMV